jgi:hypothetical protein
MAFTQVKLGEFVKSAGLERTTVAEGCMGRAVLLDSMARTKLIAWDKDTVMKVEVESQEQAMQVGLAPKNIYYLLLGRLTTDQRGNITSDEVSVEYAELSEKSYREFADIVSAVGSPGNSLILQKSDRGQYSYLQIKPANIQFNEQLVAKIQTLVSNPQTIMGYWNWIDVNTVKTVKDFIAAKQGVSGVVGGWNAQPINYNSGYPTQTFAPPVSTQFSQPMAIPAGAPLQKQEVPQVFVPPMNPTPQPNIPIKQEIPVAGATYQGTDAQLAEPVNEFGLPF